MKNKFAILIAVLFVRAISAIAMDSISLDGLWDFKLEKDLQIEHLKSPDFVPEEKMTVPGCWNSMSRYYNQHGTGCYKRTFTLEKDVFNAFLVVEGFGLRMKVWVDGREIGYSAQPWSTVEFSTGPLKSGSHEIVAAVDSVVDGEKVKMFRDNYDFYPFGGFYHGVSLLLQQEKTELRKVVVRTRDYKTGLVELEAIFAGDGLNDFKASVSFDNLPARDVEFRNRRAKLNVPDFRLWSHKEPNLHFVRVAVEGSGFVRERFGVRQVGTANGRITLNGENVYIKGVNRHESHYEFGCTSPTQLMFEDITLVKDLGGNFIRGSHYPQCESFLSLCDTLGILVWEESLGWGNTSEQFEDEEFNKLVEQATVSMVRRSINHPCIIISGFLNEPDSRKKSCKKLVDKLISLIRAEDTGHLVTFAANRTTSDICHANTDIIAYNTYPGWYSYIPETGSVEELRRNIRKCHSDIVKYFRSNYSGRRPIICSETGVKADYGVRDPRGKAQMTEDHQAEYTRLMLEEIFANKDIAGIAIWQMTDARTYTRRTRGITSRSYGVNTGGLYDLFRRPKLSAEVARELFSSKREDD